MDHRQRTFIFIVLAFIALFTLVLIIVRVTGEQAIPAPVVPPSGQIFTITPGPSRQTASPVMENTSVPPAASTTPSQHVVEPSSSPTSASFRSSPQTTQQSLPHLTQQPTQSLIIPSPVIPQTSQGSFFIAPDGSSDNDGSKEHPWSLQYVLDGPKGVLPGDTIWLRGGKYIGPFEANLNGKAGSPITLRAYPGERAILTSENLVLDIQTSSYVNFWGLEVSPESNNRDPVNRKETAYGIRIYQGKKSDHIKFINMIVHDMPAQGFGWWFANTDSEIYGSLIFFNGVNQFDHGIYLNNTEGQKRITDNIIFDNASHGIHAYGEKDYQKLNNIIIEGNTVFDNGSIGYTTRSGVWGIYQRNILVGGYQVAENPIIEDNYTYYPGIAGEAINLGYRAGSSNAIVENNYFAGGRIELGGKNQNIEMQNNTILSLSLPDLTYPHNNFQIFKPSNAKIFIRPNAYEPGRANITIYNWSKKPSVSISASDLQGVQIKKGDIYELHNVQDYFQDIVTGVFDGEKIDIPMIGHSVMQPMGLGFKPDSTFPEFGAFVLFVKSN